MGMLGAGIVLIVILFVLYYLMKKRKENRKDGAIKKKNKIVKEYKRKCNRCGKVWYSSVKEGRRTAWAGLFNVFSGISSAAQGNIGASAQSQRNVEANVARIVDSKKCPRCHSTSFQEEIKK